MYPSELGSRYLAAESLLNIQAAYAGRGQSIALAALAGSRAFVEWNHYPAADIRDKETGAIAYYHAHSASERIKGEHGHFHLFVPSGGTRGRRSGYSHLAGISITARGEALRLFTTNRWVTGEDWLPASRLVRMVDSFGLATTGRLAPVARWLTAMTCIYSDSIGTLLEQRDAIMKAHARRHGMETALEDRSIHIITEVPVNVLERLLQIDAEFSARWADIKGEGDSPCEDFACC
ncbi:hypothetical protein QU487_19715 [Crenobacter sp. SG2305]|uniref:DUF6969 family protein n=1 Tax=Crenobacter oryzisoli TaxID=3056844 RepID=UPI0025AB3958|nr:hypothetical protein [Crenobacter sp. SG2305]MDN0084946.1 hypothetical protein [Crenobacter sp. SG2305]